MAGYVRTWEDWQAEEKTVPFCPNGVKSPGGGKPWVCDDNGSQRAGKYGHGYKFNPKAQWESLINSILIAKVRHPSISYLTSHHLCNNTGKVDVGDDFPWDRLIQALKDKGWNKEDAGADPVIITAWYNSKGLVRQTTLADTDYIISNAEVQEYLNNQKVSEDAFKADPPKIETDGNGNLTYPTKWEEIDDINLYLYLVHQHI